MITYLRWITFVVEGLLILMFFFLKVVIIGAYQNISEIM